MNAQLGCSTKIKKKKKRKKDDGKSTSIQKRISYCIQRKYINRLPYDEFSNFFFFFDFYCIHIFVGLHISPLIFFTFIKRLHIIGLIDRQHFHSLHYNHTSYRRRQQQIANGKWRRQRHRKHILFGIHNYIYSGIGYMVYIRYIAKHPIEHRTSEAIVLLA